MFAPVIFTPVKGHDLVFELFESIAFWGKKFHLGATIFHSDENQHPIPSLSLPLRGESSYQNPPSIPSRRTSGTVSLYESGKVLRGLFGLVEGLFSSSKNGTSAFCGRG
jgi:hypothetical protein